MNFDIERVPFSRKGSYIAVSRFKENDRKFNNKEGVYLRTVHGIDYVPCITLLNIPAFIARIVPVYKGEEIAYELFANECEIRMVTAHGEVKICFADVKTLLLAGSGDDLGVNFEVFRGRACQVGTKQERYFLINHAMTSGIKYLLIPQVGTMTAVREEAKLCLSADENGQFLVGIEEVLQEFPELSSEYQIRISHVDGRDTMRIYIEAPGTLDWAQTATAVAARAKSKIGFTPLVKIVELGFLPRSEKKTKRVYDERY